MYDSLEVVDATYCACGCAIYDVRCDSVASSCEDCCCFIGFVLPVNFSFALYRDAFHASTTNGYGLINTLCASTDLDLSSLTILSHSPYFFLLNQCYDIRLRTCMMCLGIDVIATALPFRLLRSRTSTHSTPPTTGSSSRGSGGAAAAANRAVVHDRTVRLSTWLLATCIYSTVILLSTRTWLPSFLVVHFDGLRSLARLHASEIPRLLLFMSPLGWAMQDFVFTAVTTATPGGKEGRSATATSAASSSSTDMSSFDPASATLSETFWYNVFFWRRWDSRMKVLVERMVTVVAVAAVNTSVQTYNALEGADVLGAVGWAGMWAVANVVVSFVFGWVGDI